MAIKVIKPERVDTDLQREFAQEVFIMRFSLLTHIHIVSIRREMSEAFLSDFRSFSCTWKYLDMDDMLSFIVLVVFFRFFFFNSIFVIMII